MDTDSLPSRMMMWK